MTAFHTQYTNTHTYTVYMSHYYSANDINVEINNKHTILDGTNYKEIINSLHHLH
jgi:hypothetical protein